jgi:hypothetical protein
MSPERFTSKMSLTEEGPLPTAAQSRSRRQLGYTSAIFPGAFTFLSPLRFDNTQSQCWTQNTRGGWLANARSKPKSKQAGMVSGHWCQPP